jgi:hypothetical protein
MVINKKQIFLDLNVGSLDLGTGSLDLGTRS